MVKADRGAAIDEIRLAAPMMNRVDLLVRQLEGLTKSQKQTHCILAWMSSITTLERETIVADYLAHEAKQPRPSARISPVANLDEAPKNRSVLRDEDGEEFKDILAQAPKSTGQAPKALPAPLRGDRMKKALK